MLERLIKLPTTLSPEMVATEVNKLCVAHTTAVEKHEDYDICILLYELLSLISATSS